jgi:UDP-N-acetylglucosamine--dolichyl-phosphate N-acetylglucosaminephosphotransferase
MEPILLATIFVSFFVTFLGIPFWIRKSKELGLTWPDMNKPGQKKEIAGAGGIVPVLGAIIGIFLYLAVQTFIFKDWNEIQIPIFAIISSLLLVAGVGLIDDLFGWVKGGLSIKSRVILVLLAAIPLMVINAGQSSMFGIQLGILYPLIVIPLGILGSTVAFNMIAGFNGLETGQGILLVGSLSIVTFATGNSWLSMIGICFVAALVAFYFFNMSPAKVFPGDVLTFSTGLLIASIAILGNIEKIAIFFFIPYILEIMLKIRGKIELKEKRFAHNFGVPNEDGSLKLRYKKIYSLTHLSLFILKKLKPSGKVYEQEIVWLIHLFQMVIIVLGLWLFL